MIPTGQQTTAPPTRPVSPPLAPLRHPFLCFFLPSSLPLRRSSFPAGCIAYIVTRVAYGSDKGLAARRAGRRRRRFVAGSDEPEHPSPSLSVHPLVPPLLSPWDVACASAMHDCRLSHRNPRHTHSTAGPLT